MEIIIEIKQFNPGQMVSHSFMENNRRFMVFPLRDHFTIEDGLLDYKINGLKKHQNTSKNKCSH